MKRKFPYINTFYYEVPTVICTIRDLTIGVFERLYISCPLYVDKRLAYTQRILRGAELKKYQEVLVTCRQSEKELTGDEWTLVKLNGLSTEEFWTLENTDTMGYDVHV